MNIFYVTIIVVALDQITKLLVKGFTIPFLSFTYTGMQYGESIPVIGDFFKFTFVENPGIAFGVDFGDAVKLWLSLFSVIASIGLAIYLYKIQNESKIYRFSIAIILGGAIGNTIDRVFYGLFYGYAPLFYGKVVDFFDVDFFNFELFNRTYDRWPIFNIADVAVSVGVLLLIVFYKKIPKHENTELQTSEAAVESIPESKADKTEN